MSRACTAGNGADRGDEEFVGGVKITIEVK
jgi:hypothetical protein